MKTFKLYVACLLLTACSSSIHQPPSLKSIYANHFEIGTALSNTQLLAPSQGFDQLLVTEFNTLTAENDMKWERIHPKPREYDFVAADKLVALAQQHNMSVVGHTLVWHSQTPDWVFEDDSGGVISRDALLARMENHIRTLLTRYSGKIKSWDVVNEALNEDGTLRDSKWRQIIGDDYLLKAFEIASRIDPTVQLYYNDYNLFNPDKRAGAVKLIKTLQANGIKIDGIGLQGHYAIGYPPLDQLEGSIKAFGELGIKVMITELDVSVLPFPEDAEQGADINQDLALQAKYNPFADGLSEQVSQQFDSAYVDLFKLFLKYDNYITRVTFWGVNDQQSWRNNWPMQGRTDYPLLFDRNNQRKSVYNEIVELVN